MIGSKAPTRHSDTHFARTQSNPHIPLDPFKPVPWETYTLIGMVEPPRWPLSQRICAALCILIVIGGGLWGMSH